MNGSAAGFFVFACLASATSAGVLAHARLPNGVLAEQTAMVIRRGVWIIALMAAILLSGLTIYLKTHFDTADRDVRAFASQLVNLDQTLRRLGPEAEPARAVLFRYAARTMKDVWPESDPHLGPEDIHAGALIAEFEATLARLEGPTAAQRERLASARRQVQELRSRRWTLDAKGGRVISPWLSGLLVLWLMFTFGSLGLSSNRSQLALGVLLACAAALGSAVFLAVEYADPYQGTIIVSSEPMRTALFALSD
jgi:hypothetical protein